MRQFSLLTLVAAVITISIASVVAARTWAARSEAYLNGAADAWRDLEVGRPVLHRCRGVDEETGLLGVHLRMCGGASEETLDYERGYDEAVLAWIRRNGLPPNSYKPKFMSIEEIRIRLGAPHARADETDETGPAGHRIRWNDGRIEFRPPVSRSTPSDVDKISALIRAMTRDGWIRTHPDSTVAVHWPEDPSLVYIGVQAPDGRTTIYNVHIDDLYILQRFDP